MKRYMLLLVVFSFAFGIGIWFEEDFTGSWGTYGDNPPTTSGFGTWTIKAFAQPGGHDDGTWNTNDWYRYNAGGGAVYARVYWSPYEYWSPPAKTEDWLDTPPLDFSGPEFDDVTIVRLRFMHDYNYWGWPGTGYARVVLSYDGGNTWEDTLDTWTDNRVGFESYDIQDKVLGKDNVVIGWHLYCTHSIYVINYWNLDRVEIDTVIPGAGGGEYDYAIIAVTEPAGEYVTPGQVYNPRCIVENLGGGDGPGSVKVDCWIYDETEGGIEVYHETKGIPDPLGPGENYEVKFPDWIPEGNREYKLKFALDEDDIPDDQNPDNNVRFKTVFSVLAYNITAVEIISPVGEVSGTITPTAKFANTGTNAPRDSVPFRCIITKDGQEKYNNEKTLAPDQINPGDTVEVQFDPWTIDEEGEYTVVFIAEASQDDLRDDDTISGTFTGQVGIKEEKNISYIKFSAGERGNTIRLSISLAESEPVDITIYDITGKMVEKVYTGTAKGKLEIIHNTGRLSSGLYFVKVRTTGRESVYKFVKF